MDVTSSCKSPMNTGVQRVVRELFRALSSQAAVIPLVWDPGLAAYCTLSRRERGFLEHPFSREGKSGDAEPGRRANPIPFWSKFARRMVHRFHRLDFPAQLTAVDTLFVPEIFQDNRAAWLGTLPACTPARRVGVCHDALPWRHPDLMPAAAPMSAASPTTQPAANRQPPVTIPRRVGLFYDALTQRRPDLTPPTRQAGFAEYLGVLGTFDQIFTISQESAADLRACWRENGRPDEAMPPVTVFEWPVNHGNASRPLTPPPAVDQPPSILCVGTFEPRKNHLLLLEAADRTWDAGSSFELVLIGRTTAHWGARVEASIARLQAANRPVRWLRHVDDGALQRAYATCAFTIFPSLVEGLGLPILESLWHGRPCVCGGNGALGEVAAGGGCLVVDQRDPVALAAALTRLLADQPLYARLCVEAGARRFNSWDKLASELLPLLTAA